ncbi:Fe2+-dependent dioxygenase [Cupriavidus gilardii]|uniref:Fe2+-dependent dioxygenase n=1 Tax=Cupriavidus gilardii TaxID=82541 RepID=A0A6N1BAS8_9BURK|nr:Fe2+-dependent dioxygenase [Cupriavidus gilardii]ALD92432.1 Fe(II)-dependent oxygenase superfamily protein [Cupriavidus gilardii CR3]QQE09292.1 Fe2+-dependent dioxygenase [Cupriavidus sp. ISTL7]KAB0596497.1 Fe2+-dependent dioxygenase [Cupriavidus gilardii]MCT9016547.1 Fe2+-dependent dioxygenase [Cupriavidus gilardii]MCT9053030.1 Fe2+-dependent dioxygenase [Cupriavidus gilardii]
MLVQIPDVLTPEEIRYCRQRLERSQWVDGRVTAGDLAAQSKHNLQIPVDSAEARELGELVLTALGRNPTYHSAALPLRVMPPMFNRYDSAMNFGTHVDNAIRTVPGTGGMRIRADVSSTLFLSDPDEYEGGELVIQDLYGSHTVKLPAGHLVVYPASSLHAVTPVTSGTRWASFFWAQSMVKDDGQRRMLYELDLAIIEIRKQLGDDKDAVLALVNHYHNLLRRWAEL